MGNLPGWFGRSVHKRVTISVSLGQNGYIAIFISNAQHQDVYFDNLSVTVHRSRLLQEQNYYPFGLAINEGQSNSALPNKFLYQSKEYNDQLGLDLYDFHARQYDPQLGRFWGIDPADQFPSGYTGMGNDPSNQIDPSGMIAGTAASPGRPDGPVPSAMDMRNNNDLAGEGGGENPMGDYQIARTNLNLWNLYWTIENQYEHNAAAAADNEANAAQNNIGQKEKNLQNIDSKNLKKSSNGVNLVEYRMIDCDNSLNNAGGVDMLLTYDDPESGYSNFKWLQIINTNYPMGGKQSPYTDPVLGSTDKPFYYDKDELAANTNVYGHDVLFKDGPRKDLDADGYYFKAELILVGQKDGIYYPLQGMSWGYEIHDSKVNVLPFEYNDHISTYAQRIIDYASHK